MKNVNKVILILLALLCVTFIGCENAAKTEGPANTIVQNTGYFIDAPVAGLAYETSSGIKGVTDETGAYKYNAGDKVKFLIGNAQLGKEIEASPVVTPCTLTGATTIEDKTTDGKPTEAAKEALNMVKMFMALDSDDSDFGIKIPENLNTETLTTENLDALIKADDFATQASEVINEIVGEEKEIPTDEEAKEHYNQVAGQIDGEENLDEHNQLMTKLQTHLEKNSDNVLTLAFITPSDIQLLAYSLWSDEIGYGFFGYIPSKQGETINILGLDSSDLKDGNYVLKVMGLKDRTKVSEGDMICYYNGSEFQNTMTSNYPLSINKEKNKILYVDFTSDSHTTAVEKVCKVSGTITIKKDFDTYLAEGKILRENLLGSFIILDAQSNSLRLDIKTEKLSEDTDTIVYSYETALQAGQTTFLYNYVPFTDNNPQFNSKRASWDLNSDTRIDFVIDIANKDNNAVEISTGAFLPSFPQSSILPETVGDDIFSGTTWEETKNSSTKKYVFGDDGTVVYTEQSSFKFSTGTYYYTVDTNKKLLYLQTSSTTVVTYPYSLADTELELYTSYYGEEITLETLISKNIIVGTSKLSSGGKLKASTDDNRNIVLTFLDADGTTVTKTITSTNISGNTITWDTGDVSFCTVTWKEKNYRVEFVLDEIEFSGSSSYTYQLLTKQ